MNLKDLINKINNDEYRNQLEEPVSPKWKYNLCEIIDQDLSDAANRELVEMENQEIYDNAAAYEDETNRLINLFKEDCIKAIINECSQFDVLKAEKLFNEVYSKNYIFIPSEDILRVTYNVNHNNSLKNIISELLKFIDIYTNIA